LEDQITIGTSGDEPRELPAKPAVGPRFAARVARVSPPVGAPNAKITLACKLNASG